MRSKRQLTDDEVLHLIDLVAQRANISILRRRLRMGDTVLQRECRERGLDVSYLDTPETELSQVGSTSWRERRFVSQVNACGGMPRSILQSRVARSVDAKGQPWKVDSPARIARPMSIDGAPPARSMERDQ